MTTAEEKRRRAGLMREVAGTITTKGGLLDDDLDTLLQRYPESPDGVWWGSAATDFYDGVRDVRREVRTLRDDVLDYAERCRTRARELEDEADAQEAAQSAD